MYSLGFGSTIYPGRLNLPNIHKLFTYKPQTIGGLGSMLFSFECGNSIATQGPFVARCYVIARVRDNEIWPKPEKLRTKKKLN